MNDKQSAEYRFYSGALHGELPEGAVQAVDWPAALARLGSEGMFKPEGRYRIVLGAGAGAGRRLLEVGCGAGEYSAHMCLELGFDVTGADIYLAPHLRGPQPDRLRFVQFNANNGFDLPDQAFDIVVAMMVMEHVFEPFDFLAHVHRVLKPGGTLYLNVPLLSALSHRLTVLFGGLPTTSGPGWFERRSWDGSHLHYFTLPTLRALLAACGFQITAVRGVGRHAALKSLWPSLLCREISVACVRVEWPAGQARPG